MRIFPAVDLKGGKVVRLLRGDYDSVTCYDTGPVETALGFKRDGASCLHLVDLDGAKDGNIVNFGVISAVIKASGLFTQVGGGIRDEAGIEKYLTAGADRVILGTAAVENFDFLTDMIKKYGLKIAVGVDVKDGCVAVDGWLNVTRLGGADFCRRLRDIGVKSVIYTDISKDGACSGTNLEIYETLKEIEGLDIIASGGVSFLHEITALRKLGVSGVIIGKALYSGMLSLRAVTEAASC
ncbi:MAG: 1-(5-phosphoribosyl)-5-[(5-phosphoribosylamino)methylideneamino]imidazole-4-carboxamide isomerase [Oscillospiraceae bacterium]|nr:1-(5-phosphoribosyl)-5-[(5-phosphoribosylamino)methylideneamino]imidazole-4-carboxamide isomerase [Oscillospiraceae bacterium]